MLVLVFLLSQPHDASMLLSSLGVVWVLRRMGCTRLLAHEALLEQIARFLLGGGTAALVNVGLLAFLTELVGLWYVLSVGIASVCSALTSFLFHKYLTFTDRRRTQAGRQLAMHLVLGAWNVIFGMGFVYALVEWLGMHYIAAQILMIVFTAIQNFLIYRFWIFRRESPELATIDALGEGM